MKELEGALLSNYADKESYQSKLKEAEKLYYDSRGLINELDAKVRELARTKDNVTNAFSRWHQRKIQ